MEGTKSTTTEGFFGGTLAVTGRLLLRWGHHKLFFLAFPPGEEIRGVAYECKTKQRF